MLLTMNNIDVYKFFFYFYIIFLSIIFIITVLTYNTNAYMISKNRVIYQPAKIISNNSDMMVTQKAINLSKGYIIPNNITVNKEQIEYLNKNCHAKDGALAYQSGFDDSCDFILSYLGIREKRFKSRPSLNNNLQDNKDKIIFDYTGHLFKLNLSMYKIEWRNQTNTIQFDKSFLFKRNLTDYFSGGFLWVYGK